MPQKTEIGDSGPKHLQKYTFYHILTKNNANIVVEGLLEPYLWVEYRQIKKNQKFLKFGVYAPKNGNWGFWSKNLQKYTFYHILTKNNFKLDKNTWKS